MTPWWQEVGEVVGLVVWLGPLAVVLLVVVVAAKLWDGDGHA